MIDASSPSVNGARSVQASEASGRGGGLVETFEAEAFPPAGWTRFEFRGDDTQRWTLTAVGGEQFAYSRYSDYGSGVVEDWLVTPLLSVTPSEHTLSFDMAQQYTQLWGSTYSVAVSTGSPDQPADFVEIASWSETEGPNEQPAPPIITSGFATYTLDLSAYDGQNIYIAFIHENEYGDSFLLDNVSAPSVYQAAEPPACLSEFSPRDMATGVAAEGLVLSWDPSFIGEPPSGYRVSIGTDAEGSNIANAFDVGNSTSIELANANLGTTYYYRVEPYNSAGAATGCRTISFTTAGASRAFPYTEDFDDGTVCGLPAKWSLERNATSREAWQFTRAMEYGASEDHTTGTGCFAAVNDSSPDEAPTSLISPFFDFSDLANPTLSFWIQNQASTRPRTYSQLYVDVSTNGGFFYANGVGTATDRYRRWTKVVVDLSQYAGESNVRLRFRAVEATFGRDPFLSDISLDDVFVGEVTTGAAFAISPGSEGTYSFGEVTPCAGLERVFTITNDGTRRSALNVLSATILGDAAYSIVDVEPALPVVLGEDDVAVLRVQFNPTVQGPQSATLAITYTVDAGPEETFNVSLSGTGDARGMNSGEGDGYVWQNSTLCSSPAVRLEAVSYGVANGDTEITAWTQGGGNDGFFALDLASTIGSFRFFSEDYETAYITTNGYVFFDFGETSPGPPFPATTDYENAYIAALGDDLNPAAGGSIFYRAQDTNADGTDDELVITYFRVPRFNVPDEYATFQVILRPSATPGANGTVKLQYLVGPDGTDGQPLSQGFNNPNSFNEDARVGITGDQGFLSVLYRDNGTGGVLFGGTSLALEFSPRIERVVGSEAVAQRTGWHMLSPPTAGMTVADLAEQNFIQGIPGEYEVDNNDYPAKPNIYIGYDGALGFERPSGLGAPLTPGKGFIWFFFNSSYDPEVDVSIFTGDSQSYPLPAPIVAAGADQTGDVTVALTSAPDDEGLTHELLGNPFAASLDISAIASWTTGDLASAIGQTWDPGTRTYIPTSTLGDVLPVWEGAFFENDTATEITYPIAATTTPAARDASDAGAIRFSLYGVGTQSGEQTVDRAFVLEVGQGGTEGWDLRDATKLYPLTSTYAIAAFGGERGGVARLKAQESRSLSPTPFDLPIHIETANVTGALELNWSLDGFPDDWGLVLTDLQTNEQVDLRNANSYAFQMSAERGEEGNADIRASGLAHPAQPEAVAQRTDARLMLRVVPATRPTAAEDGSALPAACALGIPYPNPVNGSATVDYTLPEAMSVQLSVYDTVGRRVALLVDGRVTAGYHQARWRPDNLPSGLYFVRLHAGPHRLVQKVTYIN